MQVTFPATYYYWFTFLHYHRCIQVQEVCVFIISRRSSWDYLQSFKVISDEFRNSTILKTFSFLTTLVCILILSYSESVYLSVQHSGLVNTVYWLGYGLKDRGAILGKGRRDSFLFATVSKLAEAHPDSCPMGNGGPFSGAKAAEVWSWQLTST
jgi:hypothetical protein